MNIVLKRVSGGVVSAVDTAFYTSSLTSGALPLCRSQQAPSGHIQVRQPADHKEPIGVFHKATVSYLAKAEYPLKYQNGMLHLGADPGFGLVFRPLFLAQFSMATTLLLSKVPGLRRLFSNNLALPAICRVAPNSGLIAVEQVRQHPAVMHIRRSGYHRVYQLRAAVHSYMGLHAEVPLIALLRLVHLRITGLFLVLGGSRRIDDRGVNYGALRNLYAVLGKILPNQHKKPFAEVVGLQNMAELADRSLVRHRLTAKVDSHKVAHGPRVVKRLLHRRIGEIEPVLEKMDAQHPLNPDRRTSRAFRFGVERFYNLGKLPPGYEMVKS